MRNERFVGESDQQMLYQHLSADGSLVEVRAFAVGHYGYYRKDRVKVDYVESRSSGELRLFDQISSYASFGFEVDLAETRFKAVNGFLVLPVDANLPETVNVVGFSRKDDTCQISLSRYANFSVADYYRYTPGFYAEGRQFKQSYQLIDGVYRLSGLRIVKHAYSSSEFDFEADDRSCVFGTTVLDLSDKEPHMHFYWSGGDRIKRSGNILNWSEVQAGLKRRCVYTSKPFVHYDAGLDPIGDGDYKRYFRSAEQKLRLSGKANGELLDLTLESRFTWQNPEAEESFGVGNKRVTYTVSPTIDVDFFDAGSPEGGYPKPVEVLALFKRLVEQVGANLETRESAVPVVIK